MLVKIVVASLLLAAAMVVEHTCGLPTWQLLLIYLIPYICIGYDTLHEAAEGIAHGDVFNEHFLMSIATLGALAIGFLPGAETQFPEAVVVMLFFQIGELFGSVAGKDQIDPQPVIGKIAAIARLIRRLTRCEREHQHPHRQGKKSFHR